MKKFFSVFIFTLMILAVLPLSAMDAEAASIVDSGECGDNLTWTLDSDGLLTISGTGNMPNWEYLSSAPWYGNSSDIKKVIIENGVASIGDYAFYYCNSLTSVTISNSVTSIGNHSFERCSSLKNIILPNSVTYIGEAIFQYCSSLSSVIIESNITSIEKFSFKSCSSLTSITIPNSVNSIGDAAFSYCESLKSVTIPNSVTCINDSAFWTCSSLTNITIPSSVTYIGEDAFSDCSSLININVDTNNAKYSSIDGVLFDKNATKLISYPNGRNAQSYTIPNGITSIGDYAFRDCSSLKSIIAPNTLISIGNYAFTDCSSLTNIMIPNSVTSIGEATFRYCSSLANVTIPNSVTCIGNYAFEYCSSLKSITIPGSVTFIGDEMFLWCSSLTNVNILNGVSSIGNSMFSCCSSLTDVTIPNSVTSIGYNALSYCSSLKSITIPNSITYIDAGAFKDCDNLNDVYFKGTQEQWNNIKNYDQISLSSATIHFPDPPKITKQPVNTSAVIGNSAKFTIEATGDGLNYTWYFKNPGAAEFTKSAIKTSAYSVTMQKSLAGRQVYCVVGDEYGNTVKSDTVTLSLYDLKITTQPKTTYAKLGETAKVTVAANGDGLKYAWYFKNTGSTTYTKSAITSSAYSVAMQKSISGREVYCVVTDKYGNTAKSNAIKLYLAATITKQPTNATAAIGSKATASVTAAGDGLTYTWYFKNPGAADFTKSGITSSTYSVTMQKSLSGRQVYCVVTDKYGKTDKSNTVTLSTAAAVKITTQPKTTYTKVGASAKLTVAASGDGLTYTWYFKNPTASEFTKSGITSSTYSTTMQKSLSGRQVYCVVTDKYGNSVKSNTVYLYLSASITKQPTDTTAAVGEKAKVSVTAAGDGLTYTWYFKNPTASEFTKSGITSSTYSMTMQKSLSGRQVYCVVTDKYGKTVTSDTVTITAQ